MTLSDGYSKLGQTYPFESSSPSLTVLDCDLMTRSPCPEAEKKQGSGLCLRCF
ncbi:hypothetical protein Sjap_003474 [Stephania japonica]|uniref:Uncharacterized protein n=1 Tax=Stephania japonica TaxID=461633 RepID=A0AAP0PVH5_9MAGN